ncbi:MAG: M20/M25/M40 family metallo-hydrolase [Candidatus Lokiarchaeota archaeon]|nr:M20/M25/M40 family metallo-hydrolase [Candidatus Lokiarchaeota archaeon]
MVNDNAQNSIVSQIIESNENYIQNELIPFLSIPSNTLNKKGIDDAKEYILSYIADFCENIEVIEGDINPLILARVNGESKKQLLIYMMYDTQPITNEKEWISEPFGAKIKQLSPPLNDLGDCLISRGAFNSKTPLLNFLSVLKLLKKLSKLKISLLLLFDGEEEMGSPSLINFIKTHKSVFKDVIGAYYPAAKQNISGEAVLKLGYKGILSITITISTDNSEPHSSFSGLIPNPILDLISLINEIYLHQKFKIKSLARSYDVSKETLSLIEKLSNMINMQKIKKKAGINSLAIQDPKAAFIEYLFGPTFNISTLKAGYLGEGFKNNIPNSAKSNIDIRFAHDISVNEIFEEIKAIVDKFSSRSRSKVELIKNMGYDGSRISEQSIIVKNLINSFEILGVSTEIWPISAAAAPLSQIKNHLGVEFVVGGLGIGGHAHSPNEFIQLKSIIDSRLCTFYYLDQF